MAGEIAPFNFERCEGLSSVALAVFEIFQKTKCGTENSVTSMQGVAST